MPRPPLMRILSTFISRLFLIKYKKPDHYMIFTIFITFIDKKNYCMFCITLNTFISRLFLIKYKKAPLLLEIYNVYNFF